MFYSQQPSALPVVADFLGDHAPEAERVVKAILGSPTFVRMVWVANKTVSTPLSSTQTSQGSWTIRHHANS